VLDTSARASLRSALWTLRSALGDAAEHLGAAPDRLGLVGDIRTDLAEFGWPARMTSRRPSISAGRRCFVGSTATGSSKPASSTSAASTACSTSSRFEPKLRGTGVARSGGRGAGPRSIRCRRRAAAT